MSTTGSITVSHFGFLPSQQEVICYTLTNRLGFELSIMNVGAAIVSLKIPIPGNGKADVVLGFDSLEDYLHSYRIAQSPFFLTPHMPAKRYPARGNMPGKSGWPMVTCHAFWAGLRRSPAQPNEWSVGIWACAHPCRYWAIWRQTCVFLLLNRNW